MTRHETGRAEIDCPHFDPQWLLDRPDFPLDPRAMAAARNELPPELA